MKSLYIHAALLVLRNLGKNRVYAFVIVTGFTFAIVFILLSTLFLVHEYSADRFHPDHARTYRLFAKNEILTEGNEFTAWTPFSLALSMDNESGVDDLTFILPTHSSAVLKEGNQKVNVERTWFIDDSFFEIFNFTFVAGDKRTAASANSAILTAPIAMKFFGNINAVGKNLTLGVDEFTITAVIEGPPANSHLVFDALISNGSHDFSGNP